MGKIFTKFEEPQIFTTFEEPKIDTWRETRIQYTENLNNAYNSFNIETHLTYDELIMLVRELKGLDHGKRE